MAEYHLQRAMQVHPTSSILKCHCAVAMSQGGRQHQALAVVQEAIRLDPKNPIARQVVVSASLAPAAVPCGGWLQPPVAGRSVH